VAVTLADLFRASRGEPVEWAGRRVHAMLEFAGLTTDKRLLIEFAQASPLRPQALRLRVRGGVIELREQELDDVVLWYDSVPGTVIARLRPKTPVVPMSLRVWNAWRDAAGTMQAWIGNAGMLIEERGAGVIVVRCSDGFDEPSFDDLVATLRLTEVSTASNET